MPELDGRGALSKLSARLGTAVEDPFEVHGRRVDISASFGCALYPDDAHSAQDLVRVADLAMYEVKRERRADAA